MADFFGREEKQEAAEKLTIAGQEYDLAELQTLVDIGKKTQEAEAKYNTKLDRVWPEYGKSQNDLKEAKVQLEELQKLRSEAAAKQTQNSDEITEEVKQKAVAEARKLGLATAEDIRSVVKEIMDSDFPNKYNTQREGEKLLETARGLQKSIDGQDGRPKFDPVDVLNYMEETGIRSPEIAYKVKFEKELSAWEQKRFEARQPKDFFTETSSNAGRSRSPQDPKITNENLDEMVASALYGEGETQ